VTDRQTLAKEKEGKEGLTLDTAGNLYRAKNVRKLEPGGGLTTEKGKRRVCSGYGVRGGTMKVATVFAIDAKGGRGRKRKKYVP